MFKVSLNELIMLMFFLIIGVMIFVSCVYYVEGGLDSDFQSILYVFWWVVVIMMMVGYGDVFFISFLGKIVGVLCVILGKKIQWIFREVCDFVVGLKLIKYRQ